MFGLPRSLLNILPHLNAASDWRFLRGINPPVAGPASARVTTRILA
jgi:hypothetical protein